MLERCSPVYRCESTERYKKGRNVSAAQRVQSHPQFSLEGSPIYLQQRPSTSLSFRGNVSHFRINKKTYECFAEDKLLENKRETKIGANRISGGIRKASIRRREEQQKPSAAIVCQRKARAVAVRRRPLLMSTTSLPGKHLPSSSTYQETSQVFSTPEEAKATLKRFLSSRNHESMMSESVSSEGSRHEETQHSELLEKPAYLEDTYDYLFQRHVQTLNGVIKRRQQQELEEEYGLNQQKYHKQVIQLCCGDGGKQSPEDDTSLRIGCTIPSTRQSSSNISQRTSHSRCEEETGSNRSCRHDQNDINESNNNFRNSPLCTSCSCTVDDVTSDNTSMEQHKNQRHIETTYLNGNQRTTCKCRQNTNTTHKSKNSSKEITVNLVTSQINELDLYETAEAPKPLITFNHVSTCSEMMSTSVKSEVHSVQNQATLSSPPRSRSPSPLLEVPFPHADLDVEMRRPPLN